MGKAQDGTTTLKCSLKAHRSSNLSGCERRASKANIQHSATDIQMLKWMRRCTRLYRIKDDHIQQKFQIARIFR